MTDSTLTLRNEDWLARPQEAAERYAQWLQQQREPIPSKALSSAQTEHEKRPNAPPQRPDEQRAALYEKLAQQHQRMEIPPKPDYQSRHVPVEPTPDDNPLRHKP
jgi:ABC-type nitrate/sulfonate/bicarbonate transport system substrate-binding protein